MIGLLLVESWIATYSNLPTMRPVLKFAAAFKLALRLDMEEDAIVGQQPFGRDDFPVHQRWLLLEFECSSIAGCVHS
jgi:hypothetical protein